MTGNWFGASFGNWYGRSSATVYAPPITLPQLFAHTEVASLRVVQRLTIEHSFVAMRDAFELTGQVNVPVVTFDSIVVAASKRHPRRSYGRASISPTTRRPSAGQIKPAAEAVTFVSTLPLSAFTESPRSDVFTAEVTGTVFTTDGDD